MLLLPSCSAANDSVGLLSVCKKRGLSITEVTVDIVQVQGGPGSPAGGEEGLDPLTEDWSGV